MDLFRILRNGKGALLGLAVYVLVYGGCFFLTFMIAFGNPDPLSLSVLAVLDIFFRIADPLWGIPVSLLLGAWFLR